MRRKRAGAENGLVVTMSQVAALAGVSPQTVSRAMSRPAMVTEATRIRVQEAIRTLNYVPNAAARNLASNSSRIVALVIPTIFSPAYAHQVSCVVDVLEESGFSVLVGNSEYSLEREEHLLRSFLERRPQGFIVTGLQHTKRAEGLLRSAGVPVVEIWETDATPIDLAVGFSNSSAGYDVGRLFLERGARKIAFVGGQFHADSRAMRRFEGMVRALNEVGLSPAAKIELKMPTHALDGVWGLHEVLRQVPDIEAIFFSGDGIAIPALLECNRQGIDVPGRIAICGFSDYDIGSLLTPSLTSVRTDPEVMGKMTARLILARMNNQHVGDIINTVDHQIIRRESA